MNESQLLKNSTHNNYPSYGLNRFAFEARKLCEHRYKDIVMNVEIDNHQSQGQEN